MREEAERASNKTKRVRGKFKVRPWVIDVVSKITGMAGVALMGFDFYWYWIRFHDMSSFLMFLMLGFGFLLVAILFNVNYEIRRKQDRIEKELEYIEDKVVPEPEIEERAPELQKAIRKLDKLKEPKKKDGKDIIKELERVAYG